MPESTSGNIEINSPDISDRRYFIWAISLFLAIIIISMVLSFFILSDDELYERIKMTSAIMLISALHPDITDEVELTHRARDAIFESLDRYSGYIEPRELARVTEEFSGHYGGIGISVVGHELGLLVMSVREDGPAGKAGMMTGDIIIRANSVNIEGLSTYKATFLLRGPEGTEVDVAVARNRFSDTLTFTLTRERLKLIHIPYAGLTENNIMYIRILDFEAGLREEFENILDSIYYPSENEIKGIIVDLRGNPGGLLREGVSVADMFLDEGRLIVGVKGRSRWQEQRFKSTGEDIFEGLPVAILVNRGSASASEIFAGALKYANRAEILGDTTFGKGLVQYYNDFSEGWGIRLTTARYYFEGEIYLNDTSAEKPDSGIGIPPDYYIKLKENEPFPVALEMSGLLREFALMNIDKIFAYAPMVDGSLSWFNEFVEFARLNDFEYTSDLTSTIEIALDATTFSDYSDKTHRAVDSIHKLSKQVDAHQFQNYSDYIKRRLYRIALEAQEGQDAAYREVIIPYREDIRAAEKIILERNPS